MYTMYYDRSCDEKYPMYVETIPIVVELLGAKVPPSLVWIASHLHLIESDNEVEEFINDMYRESLSRDNLNVRNFSIRSICGELVVSITNPQNQSLMDDMLRKVRDLIYGKGQEVWDQELVDASIDGFMKILEVNYSMKGGLRYFFRTFVIPVYISSYIIEQRPDMPNLNLSSTATFVFGRYQTILNYVQDLIFTGAIWFGRIDRSFDMVKSRGKKNVTRHGIVDIVLSSTPYPVPQRVYDIAKRRAYSLLHLQ